MEKYFDYLRRCTFCYSFFGGRFGLCPECQASWEELAMSETLVSDRFEFPVHRLFLTTDRESPVRELVVKLKGDHSPRLWKFFAELFLLRRLQHSLPAGKVLLVPAPTSTRRQHAHYFAQALSELTGWVVVDALMMDGERVSQKSLSRGQRRDQKLRLKDPQTVFADATVVFVDDLLATGSTAVAAHSVLTSRGFQTWVLAHQLLLH